MQSSAETNRPLYVALTVDVDPDANRPARGRPDAVSAGAGQRVTLEACRRGLGVVLDVLEEFRMPCTFFWEARSLRVLASTGREMMERIAGNPAFEHGCHGLRHEDFSGQDTGVPIGRHLTLEMLHEASNVVESETGSEIAGFRAPYCRLTRELRSALARLGYRYDATLIRTAGETWSLQPYRLAGTEQSVWELALPRGRDGQGRAITGYLWQLFEGRRPPEDYIEFVSLAGQYPGGLFQLALHPWHLFMDENGQSLTEQRAARAAHDLRAVLAGITSLERIRFLPAGAYLKKALDRGLR